MRASTENEDRVRRLLGPADPVTAEPAPDPVVLARILAEPRPRSYRRRWVVGAGAVAALGAGGLVAQATGIIPDDVHWGLDRAGHGPGSEGMAPDTDRAELLFSGTAPDGLRMQYWSAPNPSGGTCTYVRVLGKDGKPVEGGWSECSRGGGNAEKTALWCSVDTNALSDWVAIYGRAPKGAVAVRVVWKGGRTEGPIGLGRDRYFSTFLPYNSRSNEEWTEGYRTEALDAHGRVVAVVHSDR
ncbi:hypothetical protein [Streptomyces sp. NPDC047043]|uniref:hypothetical protein n=1 Tax=Streptomyces sp. NPDC047043 TaxID=3154497 RepID=UPI0033CBA29B